MILRYCRWVDVHTGKNTKHGSEDKTKKMSLNLVRVQVANISFPYRNYSR